VPSLSCSDRGCSSIVGGGIWMLKRNAKEEAIGIPHNHAYTYIMGPQSRVSGEERGPFPTEPRQIGLTGWGQDFSVVDPTLVYASFLLRYIRRERGHLFLKRCRETPQRILLTAAR
jgi:hypothetical protein